MRCANILIHRDLLVKFKPFIESLGLGECWDCHGDNPEPDHYRVTLSYNNMTEARKIIIWLVENRNKKYAENKRRFNIPKIWPRTFRK